MERHGIHHFAVAEISEVDSDADALYARWISTGRNASMDYLAKYPDIRRSPELLLPGARTIICCAIPYPRPETTDTMSVKISSYALGTDYHEVLRRLLTSVAQEITVHEGGFRVCVDTAPLRERYWAHRTGLGRVCRNNYLYVPGLGQYCFLGEIITTLKLKPRTLMAESACSGCNRCVQACPTGALSSDGSIDAAKCLSYLTIEHRGDFPPDTDICGHLYGCDECARACPLNRIAPHPPIHPDLQPRPALTALTAEAIGAMTQTDFSTTFSHSAIKRTKLAGLLRNLRIGSNNHDL